MTVQPRSFGYAFATLLLVLVACWVGSNTWRELEQLHRSFASAQADDFYLPAHVEATVRELNDTVLRIDLRHIPADRVAFQKVGSDLEEWIRAHRDTLTTPEQGALMGQIEIAFEAYMIQSAKLMDEGATPSSPTPALEQVEENAAPIMDLCSKLKESERAEQRQFMNDSQRALAWVQQLLVVVLVALVIMVGTGIVAIYRGVIGPLQVELIKSRSLAIQTRKAGVAWHPGRRRRPRNSQSTHGDQCAPAQPLKETSSENSSEQEDALVIGHEIQRLERIVQEFLQFARPAEPKLVTRLRRQFARQGADRCSVSQLERASIQLKLESVPDIWVRVDPHQIEQVLINLIKNAAESMERDGTITLRVRTGTARLTGRNRPVVILEVSDTGKGIPPEVQKRIFDPFFTTKEEGTGLGLVIASRIIEKHNGTLECRSESNRGTTFTIMLPQAKPEEINEPST